MGIPKTGFCQVNEMKLHNNLVKFKFISCYSLLTRVSQFFKMLKNNWKLLKNTV